jgi:2-polyprenyl-6-methoxyphenol hydroxylase-like FAD-dependent oxidoreductase
MMLGYLLARAGIDVVVLEKHRDFLRDFRGDTIHPSTLEVIYELGLLDEFLALPHSKIREVGGQIGDEFVTLGDFTHLPTHCKFLVFMPQWDFLSFLAAHGRSYPGFALRMEADAVDLLTDGDRVAGLRADTPEGPLEIRSRLVVGADGRHSIVRAKAGLEVEDLGAPMDVLWFRLSKRSDDQGQVLGRISGGRIMVMLDRGDYWQCGFVIRKGGHDAVRTAGLDAFRRSIAELAPFAADRVTEITDWDQVKLLTVAVDRLRTWYRDGLLCIGDAAHAMSPVGGVGINLAIQDAVAAANILTEPLRADRVTTSDLERVQRRRMFPTRATQALQVFVQNRVLGRVLGDATFSLPWPVRLFNRWPVLRRLPARVIGLGFRPEHVETTERHASTRASTVRRESPGGSAET